MQNSSWYQRNLSLIKHGLFLVNIFFMIIAIKAIVNHQIIVDSIAQVEYDTKKTEQETYYINNFLTPYLQSEFAPYFFAHENNQIFPNEKIIKIIIPQDTPGVTTGTNATGDNMTGSIQTGTRDNQRQKYLSNLFSNISLGTENIIFLKK